MKYVVVPSVYSYKPHAMTVLCYKETEICEVDMITPKDTGTYDILFPILSREGDLGIKKTQSKHYLKHREFTI